MRKNNIGWGGCELCGERGLLGEQYSDGASGSGSVLVMRDGVCASVSP